MPATSTASQLRTPRFYSPDYRRQLRDAGAFRDLTLSEQVVLAALCDRANASGLAWPAAETIATQYGMGESTVREAIGRLARRGLLLVVRHVGRVNTYRLIVPTLAAVAGDQHDPSEIQTHPSEIWRGGVQILDPIMTSDHSNQHDQQQHADELAHGAAASLATPPTREERSAAPAALEDEPITMLTPDLVGRVRELGLSPAKVARYGAERVRWVLERLKADQTRKIISNPAGWVVSVLKDTAGQPLPVSVGTIAAAVELTRPPEGARWGRDVITGELREVDQVDGDSVKWSDGSRLLARDWATGWEWLENRPALEADSRTATVSDVAIAVDQVDPKQTAMAMLAAWVAAGPRTPAQLAGKLEARGLTVGDWEAWQVAQSLSFGDRK